MLTEGCGASVSIGTEKMRGRYLPGNIVFRLREPGAADASSQARYRDGEAVEACTAYSHREKGS